MVPPGVPAMGVDEATVPAVADVVAEGVTQPDDLNAPPVPELQLDFVLDRTSEGGGMLLPREPVQEVALGQLPPAPAHSERRPQREGEKQGAPAADETGSFVGIENAAVAYADDVEVAAATAAGIADSVAHGAAALASSGPLERLDPEVEPARIAMVDVLESSVVEEQPVPEDQPDPGVGTVIEETRLILIESAVLVEPAVAASEENGVVAQEADAAPVTGASATTKPESEPVAAARKPSAQESASAAAATVPWVGRTLRWRSAASLLIVAAVAAYAAAQLRSSATPNAAGEPDRLQTVRETQAEEGMGPSALTPVLDSTALSSSLNADAAGTSLADSLDAAVAPERPLGKRAPPRAGRGRTAQVSIPRRARVREPLPQIVSAPASSDSVPVRQSRGEFLPEVVTGNAPERTTTRGSTVLIAGVPDVPRLTRTTTHRPRPDVAYVLREYDASTAEPVPRAGVNEYRWRDATGSRLYVLSGAVNVTELRAYALRLQRRAR
ncbi:MAG TPA: hypothetical protein VMM17_07815 [Gemmatimonadaceae bacterium]|nr:hypothetical protein [Gemmatimonadaceae bacterium]